MKLRTQRHRAATSPHTACSHAPAQARPPALPSPWSCTHLFCRLGFAPAARSCSTTFSAPARAAKWRGVSRFSSTESRWLAMAGSLASTPVRRGRAEQIGRRLHQLQASLAGHWAGLGPGLDSWPAPLQLTTAIETLQAGAHPALHYPLRRTSHPINLPAAARRPPLPARAARCGRAGRAS